MHFLVAVKVYRPGEEYAWLVLRKPFLHKQCVGAKVDELLARDDAAHDFRQLLVQQRFAAGDGDNRRTTFVDGMQRVLDGHILVQDRIGIVDFSASGASQVASEQRLKHQDQRITLSAGQTLTDDVATDKQFLKKGNAQDHYPC